MNAADSILEFWFGADPDDGIVAAEQTKLWWGKDPTVDEEIRRRFERDLHAAANGRLNDWGVRPRDRLALILLTYQFPRNIFRGTANASVFDAKALVWSLDGIAAGLDLKLRPIERTFFYLPLEHSESLAHQNRSVELFSVLAQSIVEHQRAPFDEYLRFAERHREVIERFGRFPHRNEILGRESTAEEQAFLKEPGSSF